MGKKQMKSKFQSIFSKQTPLRTMLLLSVFVLATSVAAGCFTGHASAMSSTDYTSNLMDDSVFRDSGAMSASDIQSFLQNEGSGLANFSDIENCGSSSGAHYSYYTQYYSCGSSQRASKIVFDAAQAYGINPRVILATMQKEQSLVTTPNPTASQLNFAMGYGCPDSGGCSYPGFFNQVDNATWQFRADMDLGSGTNWWGYTPSSYVCNSSTRYYSAPLKEGNNVTFYDDNGTPYTSFTIPDMSTATLYCYTPHVYNNPSGQFGLPAYGNTGEYYSGSYNFANYFALWFGSPFTNSDVLSFVRLNHSSGHAEIVGYSSTDSYSGVFRDYLSGYPAVAGDGSVVPIGMVNNTDISFIRLNHSSGHAELVTYSSADGYKNLVDYSLTGYPAISDFNDVKPIFWPNGDLVFIRLNHSSGHAELVSYSKSSDYKQLVNYQLTGYPAVAGDGNVVPLFQPNGNLSFIRLNHSSGHVEVVTYSAASGYKQMTGYFLAGYPAVSDFNNVIPTVSR
jgi:hypothetical protein